MEKDLDVRLRSLVAEDLQNFPSKQTLESLSRCISEEEDGTVKGYCQRSLKKLNRMQPYSVEQCVKKFPICVKGVALKNETIFILNYRKHSRVTLQIDKSYMGPYRKGETITFLCISKGGGTSHVDWVEHDFKKYDNIIVFLAKNERSNIKAIAPYFLELPRYRNEHYDEGYLFYVKEENGTQFVVDAILHDIIDKEKIEEFENRMQDSIREYR